MLSRTMAAAAGLILVAFLASPARADYGSGAFTYNEWLGLHSGQTRASVEAACNCTGTWVNSGINPREIRYDNTVSGGWVDEYYVQNASTGKWQTFGSYWCGPSCQKDF